MLSRNFFPEQDHMLIRIHVGYSLFVVFYYDARNLKNETESTPFAKQFTIFIMPEKVAIKDLQNTTSRIYFYDVKNS